MSTCSRVGYDADFWPHRTSTRAAAKHFPPAAGAGNELPDDIEAVN